MLPQHSKRWTIHSHDDHAPGAALIEGPAVDVRSRPIEVVPLAEVAAFVGDEQHPDWSVYVATNLLDALRQVPDTGDWHAALRLWCQKTLALGSFQRGDSES